MCHVTILCVDNPVSVEFKALLEEMQDFKITDDAGPSGNELGADSQLSADQMPQGICLPLTTDVSEGDMSHPNHMRH